MDKNTKTDPKKSSVMISIPDFQIEITNGFVFISVIVSS